MLMCITLNSISYMEADYNQYNDPGQNSSSYFVLALKCISEVKLLVILLAEISII